MVRFNQTLQNYLKVSVGNEIYNLTIFDKMQIIDTTEIKYPYSGGYLLQNWVTKGNDKNIAGKIQNFIRSTKTHSPTGNSGATSLPPIHDSFMYIETSGYNSNGVNIFFSWERTDIIRISNITFYYNRFSSSDANLRAIGRLQIQLLLQDNTWSTKYTTPKNDRFSDSSTEWTLINLDFTIEN